MKPNWDSSPEIELRDTDDYSRFVDAIRSLQGDEQRIVCVTLGKRGIVALIDGQPHTDHGRAVKAVDTTGAGDCFVGAVAAVLADGNNIQSAFGYANLAAAVCVQRMGAGPSMPTIAEVSAFLRSSEGGDP
jgi:ribokinase